MIAFLNGKRHIRRRVIWILTGITVLQCELRLSAVSVLWWSSKLYHKIGRNFMHIKIVIDGKLFNGKWKFVQL